ncbi:MAG: class I SAM-dependent methyltransferase [Ktedonobacterales bacterium]
MGASASKQPNIAAAGAHDHRIFASLWERVISRGLRPMMDPLRAEIASQAHGVVLEVGAGNGLNFAHYDSGLVQRVEATEPNAYMVRYARSRAGAVPVPVPVTQAPAEALPFPDGMFDSALATLVFCSVDDPERALGEVYRTLKPGGTLLLVEHVRSEGRMPARVQDVITPICARLASNCHPNRDTAANVERAGFYIEALRRLPNGLEPIIVVRARRE